MALNVKQQIKKQGFETSQRKKKTERRYSHWEKICISKKILFIFFNQNLILKLTQNTAVF